MKRASLWLAVAAALLVSRAPAAAPRPSTIAITNATIWTEPGKKLEGATLVVDAGKVTAVGVGAKVPAGAQVIDARGGVVTAGFVDAFTTVGVAEIDLEPSSQDGAVRLDRDDDDDVHAAFRVIDAYNPLSVAIPIARTGGVTSVLTVPSSGLVTGQSAWVALADARRADEVTLAPVAAMHLVLGLGAKQAGGGSRGLVIERARELLDDARVYQRRKADVERNASRPLAASRLDLEALAPVLAGRVPLVVHADRASDILAALALARDYGLRVVIAGGAEAWLVADELARAKVPVIVDPTRNLPGDFDSLHVRDDGPALLARAGVPLVISTMSAPANVRTLRQLCGVAVGQGLPWDAALAAVTTGPVAAFAPGATRGKLVVGAPADVVVWSGDPFELSTRPLAVLVGGVEQPLRTRQTLLLERYRTLPPKP